MRVTTTTLQLAEAAVAARVGANLWRFNDSGRIPDHAFARNADGSITIKDVDVLKAGVFHGLQLLDEDLDAIVARFSLLLGAGIFQPPFRLDHSWSVVSVVGHFEELSTYRRVDDTDGVEKSFLRGTITISGSIDYQPAQIVDAIKRGALRNRSSEIGFYETNAGTEYPLVFYGCAFVDIPAVEGLAPVELSRTRLSVPHQITDLELDPEGTPTMDPKKLGRLKALRCLTRLSVDQTTELSELDAEATTANVTDADVEAATADETVVEVAEAVEPPAAAVPPVVDAPEGAPTDEVAALRAELLALRTERTTEQLTTLRGAGIVNDANEATARALLNHDDPEVRRHAGALLSSVRPIVELGRRHGATALSAARPGASTTSSTGSDVAPVVQLGMTPEEVGPLWASLSTEERKLRQPEMDAWNADRAASR